MRVMIGEPARIERRNTVKRLFLWPLVLILVLLPACGGRKTYLVDIKYVPQVPPSLKVKQATVAVAPFIDKRSNTDDVGIRKKLDGSLDRFTTGRFSVGESVKEAVEKFLRGNDFKVVDMPEWDLRPESLSKVEEDLVVGGEINRFWSQADSMPGRTVIRTELELAIYVGKPREGKVLKQKIEMGSEITQIIFSPGKIEETLNETLSEIIESAFAKLLAGGRMQNANFIFAKK